MVEHLTFNQVVDGSIPSRLTNNDRLLANKETVRDRCSVSGGNNRGNMSNGNSAPADDTRAENLVPPITLAEFLENVSPSSLREVSDLWFFKDGPKLYTPDIRLHCDDAACGGIRTFRVRGGPTYFTPKRLDTFVIYLCSNCNQQFKRFSLMCLRGEEPEAGKIYKYGEMPAFGPPTPPRLLRLFGSDADIFLKGRRCELQGLGIGAFVYYRRVVESHKDQIFDAIINVANKIGLSTEKIATLKKAKAETQFKKALEEVKDAIPESLLVNGHNPLTLLHSALSGHLHEKTDAECLELAEAIRTVLVELAEKIGFALSDQAELKKAVARLLQKK